MKGFILATLILLGCGAGEQPIKTYTIRGGDIEIRASEQFAGGIDSLKWNGKEFLDRNDHGRLLQSASSFDGFGECYNPTEGGNCPDGTGQDSSSILKSITAQGNTLTTETLMAYWLPPGWIDPACGEARNTKVTSDHTLKKTVTIISDHVIEYLVEFHVPRDYTRGAFETLTGYMPATFDKFWRYNPKTNVIQAELDDERAHKYPLIFSDSDGYAMGIYATGPLAYGSFSAASLKTPVVKWNAVMRMEGIRAGVYAFRHYVLVGTLEDVKAAMGAMLTN